MTFGSAVSSMPAKAGGATKPKKQPAASKEPAKLKAAGSAAKKPPGVLKARNEAAQQPDIGTEQGSQLPCIVEERSGEAAAKQEAKPAATQTKRKATAAATAEPQAAAESSTGGGVFLYAAAFDPHVPFCNKLFRFQP